MQSLLTFKVRRGKSELHRAGCWLTASQGDLKDSATEIYRQKLYYLTEFTFVTGKGGKAR